MLIKLNPSIFFARQKAEKSNAAISRKQWINADRIVMMVLFAGVIAMAIAFS